MTPPFTVYVEVGGKLEEGLLIGPFKGGRLKGVHVREEQSYIVEVAGQRKVYALAAIKFPRSFA